MSEGGEEEVLVADLISRPISRRTFLEKVGQLRACHNQEEDLCHSLWSRSGLFLLFFPSLICDLILPQSDLLPLWAPHQSHLPPARYCI